MKYDILCRGEFLTELPEENQTCTHFRRYQMLWPIWVNASYSLEHFGNH
jgi:hypothetical protein